MLSDLLNLRINARPEGSMMDNLIPEPSAGSFGISARYLAATLSHF